MFETSMIARPIVIGIAILGCVAPLCASAQYRPEVQGISVASDIYAHIAGIDLGVEDISRPLPGQIAS